MAKPAVSIVVPVFNGAHFLERSLSAIRRACDTNAELIVVDDGSRDGSATVAERYAHRVVRHETNRGLPAARQSGVDHSTGDIVVFFDADVCPGEDAVARVCQFFDGHPEFDAVTGLLAKEHPNPDLVSQWKNLYMHYNLSRMPREVELLYGAVFAVRRHALVPFDWDAFWLEDSAYGQKLVRLGHRIAFIPDLEVVHLHAYTLSSMLKLDFNICRTAIRLLQTNESKRSLAQGRALMSADAKLVASALLSAALVVGLAVPPSWPMVIAAGPSWWWLNREFLAFLKRERGGGFMALTLPITLVDHAVRGAGIMVGALDLAGRAARARR